MTLKLTILGHHTAFNIEQNLYYKVRCWVGFFFFFLLWFYVFNEMHVAPINYSNIYTKWHLHFLLSVSGED